MGAKGNTKAPLGVLEEIEQRLAAITPEQFVTPPDAAGADVHAVCPATDRIKRMFTLRSLLADECDAINAGMRSLADETVAAIAAKNPDSILEEFTADNDIFKAGETKFLRLHSEREEKVTLGNLVDKILWIDVRRQHPDLKDKPAIGVYGDWSIGWREEDEEIDVSVQGNRLVLRALQNILGR